MNREPIHLYLAEPNPVKVLIEEDLWALKTLSNLLTSYARSQASDPVNFNEETRAAFLSISQTIQSKVSERTNDYSGQKYIIMAKGRRKIGLWFKREPDTYIGSDYGINFLNACKSYFFTSNVRHYYNQRRNTLYGRMLYPKPVTESKNYNLGYNVTATGGYSSWFIIDKFIFRLAEVKSKGEAVIGCKMLHKAFQNLLAKEYKNV